jgi:hypothetical protein
MDASPLGKLPAELRAAIFELVLRHPSGVSIDIDQGALKLNSPSPASHPLALPSTCHQARSESNAIFWRDNHFRFTVWAFNDVLEPREIQQVEAIGDRWPNVFHHWLSSIGSSSRLIRSIDLDLGFWNTARREQNDLGREFIASQLARLNRRWCQNDENSDSSLRLTAYVLVSYNVNSHCLWGLRLGLSDADLSNAAASVREGGFEVQRSIVHKDEPLGEGVSVYGFYGKRIFPSTRTALLAFLDGIRTVQE